MLHGYRHGVRGEYTQEVAPLLLTGTDGLALNRLPGDDARRDPQTGDVILDAEEAALVLTDTTYLDFTLDLELADGPAPVVRLGDDAFGTGRCTWPTGQGRTVTFVRTGSRVELRRDKRKTTCAGPSGRARIQIARGGGPVTLHSVTITRGAASG